MSEFKERIRLLREQYDFSQQELADRIGVHKQTISQYERGIRKPDFDTLLALCDVFNVSSDYMLGNADITPRYLETEELNLLHAYRNADDLTKQMILRLLNVQQKSAGVFAS